MKKTALIIFTLILTGLCANADTYVKYGITGQPTAVSFNGGPFISYSKINNPNYYRNYNNRVPYYNNRMMNPHIANRGRYYNPHRMTVPVQPVVQVQPIVTPKPISRLDKNYVIDTPQSYTRNGITYFN